MTEPVNEQEINDLFTKLDAFAESELTAQQRELLTNMIAIARAVVNVESPEAQRAFAEEFDGAFSAVADMEADYGQCKMVSRKVGAGTNQVFITQMITR